MYVLGTSHDAPAVGQCPTCPEALGWGAIFKTGFAFTIGAAVAGGVIWLGREMLSPARAKTYRRTARRPRIVSTRRAKFKLVR